MEKKIERNEALLLFGRWTSKIGDIVFDYVNSIIIVHTYTNTSWILAAYQSSQVLINILFNLIGGAFADFGRRKKIIIITDCISAIICFIASFFVESEHVAIALILANALLALVFSFSSPTFKAIVKEMVQSERIKFYNSVSNAGSEIISITGPFLGVIFISLVGAKGALLIDAATFLVSALSECFLVKKTATASKMDKKRKHNIIRSIAEGVVYLINERTILYLLILSAEALKKSL